MIEIKDTPNNHWTVYIDGNELPDQLNGGIFIRKNEGIMEVDCYMIHYAHNDHADYPYQVHTATIKHGKQHRIITYYFNLSKLKP